ncbi:cupin domain-containing protein [Chitinophaga japonensis]|uniref:Quercetin dioxygenase-like cupin family protein n=1 Tax=Chitinophaga japonensis TaxID=104662 RepID=A0A562TEF2_CHIJA|nr:cupin domain-containing protein [Chitinophaga japonensis]TWI91927.1 quercetin dioxygenase-like cupin family protein [Chitinophaga japonensis]
MPPKALKDIPGREIVTGFTGRFVHGERSTLSFWEVTAGCALPVHQHDHEQITYIAEGTFEMQLGDEVYTLHQHDTLLIPSNTPHGGRAITNCRIIDTFCPVREDYK